MRTISAALVALTFGAVLVAQHPTLRERVTMQNSNVVVTIKSDSQPVTLAQLLDQTDVIVRGRVGDGVSRLSDDERSVLTTYELINPNVSFSANPQPAGRPGAKPRAISVSVPGGTVPIDAFTATVNYAHIPTLRRGMEIIVLLKDRDGTYVPAAGHGVFVVRDARVLSLSADQDELQKFRGTAADDFVRQIVALRKNVPRK